ncbi:EamA-like transporter family protein [Rhizobium sp. RU20A]|uniref:DMT family transporter n=1 Tax=Rhizobium sp. RU20A TaxID=1907412 RepID=UPI0009551563|nr:DMT family transporter [Rhizobium sp. RU20A]SIR28288.1 EamA-like transporter family protein [Rhizobium sp. RU20A]
MPALIFSAARSGAFVMLLATLMFSLNDTMGKWLVASYSVGQVVLIRSAAALILLAPFLMKTGWRPLFALERPGLQVARVAASTAEIFLFYAALQFLPLADVMTYLLAAPIYVAAVSPLVLGETVGWRRWSAIVVGFIGVVIALDPSGQALGLPALICLIGSMCFAFMMVTARSLRGTPDTVLVFWQIVGAALVGIVWAPFDWAPVQSAGDLVLLGLLGIVAMLAHVLVNRAMKLADAATVAPLQYALLFWAVLFGYLFFGDVPRTSIVIGAVLIMGSGTYIVLREQKLKRRAARAHPSGHPRA